MARYARNWTREQLADETGLTVDQIDAIENGEANPGRVLDALGLVDMQLLTTEELAAFSMLVHPKLMQLDPDHRTVVLAQLLDTIAHAAAGIAALPRVGQVTVVHGDVIQPDIEQQFG